MHMVHITVQHTPFLLPGHLVAALGWGLPAPKVERWWPQRRCKSPWGQSALCSTCLWKVECMQLGTSKLWKCSDRAKQNWSSLPTTPAWRKSETEYCALLAKTGVRYCSGSNIELGLACGKYYRVCTLTVIDPGDWYHWKHARTDWWKINCTGWRFFFFNTVYNAVHWKNVSTSALYFPPP